MTGPLVSCDNLVKIYKEVEGDIEVVALQGLDMQIRAGEMLAIVGRSGSGKTTLLNILGGLDLPSAGQCVVAGYTLTRLNERERNAYRRFVVGHVWQQSGRNLLSDLSLLENVGLPQMLAGMGMRHRTRRSKDLLDQMGLGRLAHKRPDQLSGGEQQRGAIAVALANEPRLLLADEPTGELDTQTAQEIISLLRSLTRSMGLTVILVTHDTQAAAEADRTIVIRDGRASTETIRREQPLASAQTTETTEWRQDAESGLPIRTHRESAFVDNNGRLQLPEVALRAVRFNGRAELRISADHVELWPVGAASGARMEEAPSAAIGLPANMFRETVVIDRVGRLQLSEESLDRVPFGRHANVQIRDDHIELWPVGNV